jgi:hypothetical protein
MKWIFAALLGVLVVYVGFLALSSNDVVTSKYRTLDEARRDLLFQRGWLPDILPPSARDIRTSNNLDINTSKGEFSFVPAEYAQFAALVQRCEKSQSPFFDLNSDVVKMKSNGYLPSMFTEDSAVWVFFCGPEAGHCKYVMWLEREANNSLKSDGAKPRTLG